MKMRKSKKIRNIFADLLSICAGVLLLTHLLNAAELPNEPRIFIKIERLGDCRRIWVQYSDSVGLSDIVLPEFRNDVGNGKFRMVFPTIDSRRYFGMRKIQDKGALPVRLIINVAENVDLTIDGITFPDFRIDSYYSFDRNSYIFDIRRQTVGKSLSAGLPVGNSPNDRITTPDRNHKLLVKNHYRNAVRQSIFVVGVLFSILVMFFLIGSKIKQHNRQNPPDTIDMLITDEFGELESIPQPDDNAIRELADRRTISYDEAALILQTQNEVN
jgi:hypothetical protein